MPRAANCIYFCLLLCAPCTSYALTYLNHTTSDSETDWGISLAIDTFSWPISGNFVNVGKIDENVAGSFSGTGDSLNLPKEMVHQFFAVISNHKWNVGLYYQPIQSEGTGTGLAAITTDDIGGFATVDVVSDIDLEFIWLEATYNLIATENACLSIGAGAGQIDANMNFSVETGDRYSYQETSPYAHLSIHMMNRLDRFYYGFSVNGFKYDNGETDEEEADYTLAFAYRLFDTENPIDVRWGWRHKRLNFNIENVESRTSSDVELKGPYLGLAITL